MKLPLGAVAATVLLGTLCAPGTAASANVPFEEQTLVPDITSAQVTLSPRGVRVAAVIPKGSRQALVLDGVEGPRFDEIMSPGGLYEFTSTGVQVQSAQYGGPKTTGHLVMGLGGGGTPRGIFSRDGQRHAYVGRSGSDVVLMLDGKEVHRGPYQQYGWLAFSPDGKRLFGEAVLTNGQRCLIVDGQPGPVGFDGGGYLFLSPDGAHYAYTGKNNDPQQTPWMVLDGRQVKHIGDIVGFTATGALFTRTVANYNQVLLANGKPMAQGSSFNFLALNGNRLVLAVTPALGNPPQRKPSVITVDGQVIAGTEDVGVNRAYFSPDGKRYALLCQRTDPRMETFMIVDGKKELSYQSIYSSAPYEPSFSADSTKFAYVAMAQGGGMFVVVNGEESDAFGTLAGPYWSEVGSRLAYGGTTPAQKPVWFIDGKSIPLINNQPPGSTFRFTPDGAHHSWSFGPPHALTLVVDGKPIPNVGGTGFIGAEGVDGLNATVRISPDGKHLAYSGIDPQDNSRRGIWVDGKLVTPMTAPQGNRVTFSPDSQHVAWATYAAIDNVAAYRVFVDGREVLHHASTQLDNTPGAWEMGADGTLTLLGVQDGALKRFRIPPPADSSIAAMVASVGGATAAATP